MPPLLEVRDLTVRFDTPDGTIHAVNGVSYAVGNGETLGVVGESGSGKSVHVLAMLGLIPRPPGRVEQGEILFEGRDLLKLADPELRAVRGSRIGFVFQDPMTALNPVLTVGRQIGEPLRRHQGLTAARAWARAIELLDLVGIPEPRHRVRQYPHQFSGGMRQRVMIAIAIACNPTLLIADEPTTALDVSIQDQIVDLIRDLRRRLSMTVIWITHDMGVVAGLADTVQVMYAGRIVERGPVRSIFKDPRNAYTWGLLRSIPRPGLALGSRLHQIPGQPPDLYAPAPGDPFAERNPFATERCFREMPPLRQVENGASGHLVAAWYDLPTALGLRAP
jgi:peptide/nickel transport system ATP-binding protein/oligopeptide transport system ATP-binding protein